MGSLTISHNFQGETDFIICVPKKTTAPLADVICTIDGVTSQTRKAYPAPHSQRSILIEGLDPVWYFIKFYRSVDGTSLDQELLTLAGNALTGALYPITKYEYVVDRGNTNLSPVVTGPEVWADPAASAQDIRDERLFEKTFWVEERGTGTLLSSEIVVRDDEGGGFDFADGGKFMFSGGVYIVTVIEKVDQAPTSGSGSSDFNDVVILTADLDFDPAIHSGRTLVSNWASNIGTLTIPNLSLLPDCKFRLQTHGGTQSFVGIQLDTGDTIEFRKSDLNIIWLGSGEQIEIIIKSNVMYAGPYSGDYNRVGQRIWGEVNTELNAVVRDGTQYLKTALPRLVQWIDEYSVPTISEGTGSGQWSFSQVVDNETVFPNKGKFAIGATTIRVPDDRDMFIRALKHVDGVTSDAQRLSQGSGGRMQDGIREHNHTVGHESTASGLIYRKGAVHTVEVATGSGAGNFDQSQKSSTGIVIRTTDDSTHGVSPAADTRGKNIGMLPLLIV